MANIFVDAGPAVKGDPIVLPGKASLFFWIEVSAMKNLPNVKATYHLRDDSPIFFLEDGRRTKALAGTPEREVIMKGGTRMSRDLIVVQDPGTSPMFGVEIEIRFNGRAPGYVASAVVRSPKTASK